MKQAAVSIAVLMCFIFSSLILEIFRPAFTTQLALSDILTMASRIRAKESCTCLFVIDQDPGYCDTWTKDISLNAAYEVDAQKKEVRAWYKIPLLSIQTATQTATFLGETRGCLLDIND